MVHDKCLIRMLLILHTVNARLMILHFSFINIGDRGSGSFKQLNELFAGNGMIGYVAKERVDGKLILPEAVQIMKLKGAE